MFFFPKSTNILWAFLSNLRILFVCIWWVARAGMTEEKRLAMGMREEMVQAGQSVAWMCRHGVVNWAVTKNHCWVMLKYYYYVVYWGTWLYYNHGNTSNYLEYYWWQSLISMGLCDWPREAVFILLLFQRSHLPSFPYCHNVLRHVPMNIHKYYLFWNRRPGSPHATNTLISAEFVGLPFSLLN